MYLRRHHFLPSHLGAFVIVAPQHAASHAWGKKTLPEVALIPHWGLPLNVRRACRMTPTRTLSAQPDRTVARPRTVTFLKIKLNHDPPENCPTPLSRRYTPKFWWPTSLLRFAHKLTRCSKRTKLSTTGSIMRLRSSIGQTWQWHGSKAVRTCYSKNWKSSLRS